MNKFVFTLFLITATVGNAVSQDNRIVNLCTFCDTTFYHRKPLTGEVEEVYPSRIICYFTDSVGNKTPQKCHDTKFVDGLKNGSELIYYYSDKVYLVNWWGRPYRKPIKPWRKKIFASEMRFYPISVKGYWKEGKKHGQWKFYDLNSELLRIEEYKNDELVDTWYPKHLRPKK